MVESLVLLEIIENMASFSKNTALTLFCCFRQSERSVHYALSFPKEWPEFLAYYDKAKRTHIAELIRMLRAAGAARNGALYLSVRAQYTSLSIVSRAANALCNQFKNHWSFSVQELSFFCRTLERFIEALHKDLPSQEELIELRTDCFRCHYAIARRLIGVSAIRKAASIEHFNQSEYVEHYNLDEIVFSQREGDGVRPGPEPSVI
jgi:hypothetical protein